MRIQGEYATELSFHEERVADCEAPIRLEDIDLAYASAQLAQRAKIANGVLAHDPSEITPEELSDAMVDSLHVSFDRAIISLMRHQIRKHQDEARVTSHDLEAAYGIDLSFVTSTVNN